jgi:glycerophosphoryl diester phosphodiesterase
MPKNSLPLLVATCLLTGCVAPPGSTLGERLHRLAASTKIVVGHRGDSGANPENTLPSFASAVAVKADMVELDFYQTEDGVLVCFHDRTLDRTTNAVALWKKKKTRVADYTWEKLATLDAGSWKDQKFAGVAIPTLESALRLIQAGSITMIEHKAGDPDVLVALLRRMNLVDDVLVQSFDWTFLTELHRLEPRITLAALGGTKSRPRPTGAVLHKIERTGAAMVHWSAKRIRRQDVDALHTAGYLVCVYTVNEPADYDRVIALGVDAITTNYPRRLRSHLATRK